MENSTQFKFFLLGLTNIPYLQAICLLIFSIMYLTTLLGNSLLVLVVRMNPRLQTPMYFLLSNLSIVDILFSSTIVPKLLVNTIVQDKSISLRECAFQIYAAICKPLHYNTIMSRGFCECLVAGCWAVGIINSIFHVVLTFQLTFCRLSCQDPWFNELAIRKAFSTCVSHITVVSMFYGAILIIYSRPHSAYSPESGRTSSIIYTSVTPMLNPIIYSMRNRDIKESIRKIFTSLSNKFH
ncbi:hypothetical protein GDO86_016566 [Hymenochirus boettgeri]|uniref:G-protein coupled receptors family 1 profile domain-containing protein n=1 Tax=Hymenochirus boettgeri TaxID=247094 RepID=A0A8T2K1N1_9PIPI|nr:hypothetical protein GDO86_016566 [Hymenochirus boettgeri]